MSEQPRTLQNRRCEAIVGYFVFGPQRCMHISTGMVDCWDLLADEPHQHPACLAHGGTSEPTP